MSVAQLSYDTHKRQRARDKDIAERSYMIADWMLWARDQPTGPKGES